MTYRPSEKEVESVERLVGAERYRYFVKRVADTEEVWSLFAEGGWASAEDGSRCASIPVWPHSAFAVRCVTGLWAAFEPKRIPLDIWLERWIPGMTQDGKRVAVFPTPADRAVVVEPLRLGADLERESESY